jgi:hypothetical protein
MPPSTCGGNPSDSRSDTSGNPRGGVRSGRIPRIEYRHLGASGLRVSAFGLGTMTFGGRDRFAYVGTTDVNAATRQLDRCLDAGINFVDTADVYSGGLAEKILGEAIKGRRDGIVLATKARISMGDGPNDAGLSRRHLLAACEASLRRLGVDHVDLYHVHEWDGITPLEETLDALVRSGKIRYIGCSNYAGWQMTKALGVSERRGFSASSASRSTTRCSRARGVRADPVRDRPGRRDPRLEPAGRRPALRQVPPRSGAADRIAPAHRVERAARPRRGPALPHRRRTRRDRGRARRLGRAGCARLAAQPPRRRLGDHRRAYRGAARRQPGGGRAGARRHRTPTGSTSSARRRCCTRSGTRPRRRRTAWGPPTARCWVHISSAEAHRSQLHSAQTISSSDGARYVGTTTMTASAPSAAASIALRRVSRRGSSWTRAALRMWRAHHAGHRSRSRCLRQS